MAVGRELTALGRRPSGVKRIPFAAVAVAVVAALTMSGCAHTGSSGDSIAGPPSPAELDRMARDVVAKWEPILAARGTDAPFLLRTQPSQIVGEASAIGDAAGRLKEAWLAGRFTAAGPLPAAPVSPVKISGPGGPIGDTRVMSAEDTLAALVKDGSAPCQGCDPTPLKVTGAVPGKRTVSSTRGPVEVPTWVFSLDGYPVDIERVAIPADSPLYVPQAPDGSDSADPTQKAVMAPDGRSLTLTHVGAPDQPGPCGSDMSGHAIEAAHVVAIVIVETPHRSTGNGTPVACPAIGAERMVEVTLAAPLGSRVVLGTNGQPLAVTGAAGE